MSNPITKFKKSLNKFSEHHDVLFSEIKSAKDIDESTVSVIIIVGFDVHQDLNLIYSIIKKCKTLNIHYKILFQKEIDIGIEDINLEKGAETSSLRHKLESEYNYDLVQFQKIQEFEGLLLSVLREHKPEVILQSLNLVNIGHFENATIDFDNQLTCLVGENGQGKSSILRALVLSIIGTKISRLSTKNYEDLLRIKSISEDGNIEYFETGLIVLNYKVDNIGYQNAITFESKDEGRIIEVSSDGDFEINSTEFNLKSLIVGFPQIRGNIVNDENRKTTPYTQPHIDDLLPLLLNNTDNRINSFVSWIANLYGDAVKEGNLEDSKEFAIINYIFEVISDLTGKKISFKTVQQFTPPVVIISTPESPNGIPLNLISQGFKIVIGWIGYFIERKIESFPLTSPYSNSNEKSILIIDEIDSSIHPIWQSRLLDVLRAKFPSTQIICTTHSPIMLAGLNREQISEIKLVEDKMCVSTINLDTWVTTYKEILKLIFKTPEFVPKITKEELQKLIEENIDNPEQQIKYKEKLQRLEENERFADEISDYEMKLKKKELELEQLIEEFKNKIND